MDLGEMLRNGVPTAIVGQLNRTVGARVIQRVARRRARVAVGRLIPAGVGVVIAAGADYMAVRSAANAALSYLEWTETVEGARASLSAA